MLTLNEANDSVESRKQLRSLLSEFHTVSSLLSKRYTPLSLEQAFCSLTVDSLSF